MELEALLPAGCAYTPSDLKARDARTIVCDYDKGQFPGFRAIGGAVDRVVAMGVLEYMGQPRLFLRALRRYQARALLTYCCVDLAPLFAREAQGWRNHLTLRELRAAVEAEGFTILGETRIDALQILFELGPSDRTPPRRARKSVCVLAYDNVANFGDRLGWTLLSPLLPPGAVVERHTLRPFSADPRRLYDLVIVGIGNSLFGGLFSAPLQQLVENARWSIGLFGTQYRAMTDAAAAKRLIERLDLWCARYEEDLFAYGRNADAIHMGDWLIGAFPQTRWSQDGELVVDKALSSPTALDRAIVEIQRWRAVRSPRLHPLLCALTSAERVAYAEQREWPKTPDMISGKFQGLLMDVFGRGYPENDWFAVDHDRVGRYREHVAKSTAQLRRTIEGALTPEL